MLRKGFSKTKNRCRQFASSKTVHSLNSVSMSSALHSGSDIRRRRMLSANVSSLLVVSCLGQAALRYCPRSSMERFYNFLHPYSSNTSGGSAAENQLRGGRARHSVLTPLGYSSVKLAWNTTYRHGINIALSICHIFSSPFFLHFSFYFPHRTTPTEGADSQHHPIRYRGSLLCLGQPSICTS